MNGKYLKKEKTVLQFSSLSLLASLADIEDSFIQKATGEELIRFMSELPSEIRVILDNTNVESADEEKDYVDDSEKDSYKQVVVRINGLVPKFAKMYLRNPISRDKTSIELLPDFTSKSLMDAKINNLDTVASLKNYNRVRGFIESSVGLKDLYTEVRPIEMAKRPGKGKANMLNDRKIALSGGFDIELVGNFKNCRLSLADNYMMDNNIRKMLTSGRLNAGLGAEATRDGIVRKATPDSAYAALATYYGVFNCNDADAYDSFKDMTAEDFAVMTGKIAGSYRTREEILRNTDWCGIDRSKYLNRMDAIKLASRNLGNKVYEIFTEVIDECKESNVTGSLYFSDIKPGDVNDTAEVAAFLTAGIIRSDEYGRALLNEAMNMSKAIRVVFSLLECAVKIDLDNTEYIDIDECVEQN